MLPAYTYFAWACYAVDLKENRLTVYDPTLPDDADKEVVSLHVQVCDKIKKALADCAGMFFDGWQYDRAALEIKLLYRKQNMREVCLHDYIKSSMCIRLLTTNKFHNVE